MVSTHMGARGPSSSGVTRRGRRRAASAASVLAAAAAAGLASRAGAATYVFDPGGQAPPTAASDGSGAWDGTTSDWFNTASGAVGPWGNTTGDTAVFGVGGTAGTVTVGAVNVGTISFNQVTGSYNLTGGTINLGGAATVFADAGVSATIGSALTAAGLNKTGAGTVTLTGSDTFTNAARLNVLSGTMAFDGNSTSTFANEIAIGSTASPAGASAAAPNVATLTVAAGTTLNSTANVGLGNGDASANQLLVLNVAGTLKTTGQLFTAYASNASPVTVINVNGTVNAGSVALGLSTGTTSTFNMLGGAVTSTGAVTFGSANGTTTVFNMSGGTFTAAGSTNFGSGGATAKATVNLTGGSLLLNGVVATGLTRALAASTGQTAFNLSGTGSVTIPSYFYLTNAAGATTVVTQTGGTFNATGTGTDGLFFSNGLGTYNLAGGVLSVVNVGRAGTPTAGSGFIFNGGTLQVRAASGMGTAGFFVVPAATVGPNGGTIDTQAVNSLTTQAIASGVTGGGLDGGLAKAGSGSLTLTGASTYTGPTNVSAGALILSAAGSVNGTSGVTVNGAGARFVLAGTVASTPAVTVTTGAVDGTGTVGPVTVGAGTGGVVTNGNGLTGTLTLNALTFLGGATDNVVLVGGASTTVPGQVVTNALTTPATAGAVVVNVTAGSLNNGTYNLIQYGTLAGGGLAGFSLGTVTGVGNRQTETLGLAGNNVVLIVSGSLDQYTGANSNVWSNGAGANNFRLTTTQAAVDFVNGDAALFDDTANPANTAVTLGTNVVPASTTFNNSSQAYSVNSGGGFGIGGTGALTKNGTGALTVNTSNSYTGGTTLNAGTLNLGNAAAIGTGPLTINGGTLGNTTGGPLQLPGNAVLVNGDFTLAGASQLNTGTGAVTLSGNRTVTVAGGALYVNGPIDQTGTASLTLAGGGTTTLAAASTYTGGTTVTGGTVNLQAGGASGTVRGPLTVGPGATVNLNAADAIGYAAGSSVTTLTVNGGTVNLNVAPAVSTNFTSGNVGFITNVVLGGGQIVGVARSTDAAAVPGRLNFSPGYGITSTASGTTSVISTGVQLRAGAALAINTASGTVPAAGPDLRIDGQITEAQGVGTVTKLGAGTLSVTDAFGASTYTGGTTISQGTVRANDVTSGTAVVAVLGTGTTTVQPAGTLGGNGQTGGPVVVAGRITAGADAATIGTLNTGAETWNSSGGYVVKLGAGTSSDQLVMTGLTIAATAGAPFTVNPSFTGTVANQSSYVIAVDTNATGTANPFAAAIGSALVLGSGTARPDAGLTFQLSTQPDGGGYDLLLNVVAAPEPTSLVLLAASGLPLALGRRRRPTGRPGVVGV